MSTDVPLSMERLDGFVERGERDRFAEMVQPGIAGAHAALETFYHAHNTASVDLHRRMGIAGNEAHLLARTVRLRAELTDVARYAAPQLVVFCGVERGSYEREGVVTPHSERTTRVFAYIDNIGWRQMHHHGSIDDPAALAALQQAMKSPAS